MQVYLKTFVAIFCLILCSMPCFAVCPSADLTRDCFVDFADIAILANQWLNDCNSPDWCDGADINHIGSVGFIDYAVLAGQWLTGSQLPSDIVLIYGGTFQMGDPFSEGWVPERPVHTVTLDSFSIGKCEITNQQYCDFLNLYKANLKVVSGVVYAVSDDLNYYPYCDTSAISSYSQIAYGDGVFSVLTKGGRSMANDPMVMVNWFGSVAYCNWRSYQEGREQCYDLSTWDCDFSKHGYRLPTEAEWEYAARGGLLGNRFPWGDTITHSLANYLSDSWYAYDVSPTRGRHPTWSADGIIPYTSPVDSFSANGYGLYDMAGNVYEWCNDWYLSTYYDSSPSTNPTGPTTGTGRVSRSGSWNDYAIFCRVANRSSYVDPVRRFNVLGFRVALDFE